MTSPLNSRERVIARSVASDIFPVGRPVVVAIHKSGNHTSGNPAVRFRYYPQSAPRDLLPTPRRGRRWSSSPGVGHLFGLLPRMMRPKPHCALLGSPTRRTGGTFRRVVNFCRALPGWSTGFLRTLAQPRKQSSGVFTVFACPHPFVGAVLLHARNKSMEMEAWRAEKYSIRSVK